MGQVPISGRHRHQYPSGDVYIGNYEESQRSGQGDMTYQNSDSYSGAWFRDSRHGEGKMIYAYAAEAEPDPVLPSYIPADPNSLRHRAWRRAQLYSRQQRTQSNVFLGTYEGYWLSDKRNAYGQFTYSNSDIYYGEWSNDQRQGRGLLLLSSGDEYEGQYKLNSITGWGMMKLNCFDLDTERHSMEKRKTLLRSQSMQHLYSQIKQKCPQQFQLGENQLDYPDTVMVFLHPAMQAIILRHGKSELGTFGIISEATSLLQYAITVEQYKQAQMNRYGSEVVVLTHTIEVEGLWNNNVLTPVQLDGETSSASPQTESSDATSSPYAAASYPVGYCIVRKYGLITTEDQLKQFQIANELQSKPTYMTKFKETILSNELCPYLMLVAQGSQQYLCEIYIVPAQVGSKVVETYGRIDLDLLLFEHLNNLTENIENLDEFTSATAAPSPITGETIHISSQQLDSIDLASIPINDDDFDELMGSNIPDSAIPQGNFSSIASLTSPSQGIGTDTAEETSNTEGDSKPSQKGKKQVKVIKKVAKKPTATQAPATPMNDVSYSVALCAPGVGAESQVDTTSVLASQSTKHFLDDSDSEGPVGITFTSPGKGGGSIQPSAAVSHAMQVAQDRLDAMEDQDQGNLFAIDDE